MKDYARQDAGASIVMATSVDERFPPENIIDGAESFGAEAIGTFWMTTGMFPQELVVALANPVQVSQIVIMMLNGEGSGLEGGESRAMQICSTSLTRAPDWSRELNVNRNIRLDSI
jgi:hypothetical protein